MQLVLWIVENFVKDASFTELVEAIKAEGHPTLELKGDFTPSLLAPVFTQFYDHRVIFNGSIMMEALVREALLVQASSIDCPPPRPISWISHEHYRCVTWMSRIGPMLFNDHYAFITLSELKRRDWEIYGEYGKEGLIWIRPDSGNKPFQPELVDIQDLDRFAMKLGPLGIHELVLVSTPKTIRGEWRFVVSRDRGIIAVSCYRYQGQRTLAPSAPEHVTQLVNQARMLFTPDPIFVIDACEDADGRPWIMELNSFSCAGLYACNKRAIVKEATRIAAAGS